MHLIRVRTRAADSVGRMMSRYGIVIAMGLIELILSFSTDDFLTAGNITNVLRQVSINGILAVGMTFVILTGGIALSIGSLWARAGMVGASLVVGVDAHAPITAALVAIVVGAGLGA